ncbi:MAG: fluoride efflux transporter CrcB [Bacteroidetes bacterium]|nr:fluoride efflux transporter CrcB [Bacteroidota bacterium]
MLNVLLVALGGAVGASLRYVVSVFINRTFEFAVLSGTLTVNLVGSLVIGILMGLLSSQANFSEKTYLLLVVGILGGFTTFSSYSFENLELLQQGMYRNFVLYLLISNIGGILLAFLGYKLALNSINI